MLREYTDVTGIPKKFVKFVIDHVTKEVSEKDIAKRKREAKKHIKYLQKHKMSKKKIAEAFKHVPKKHKAEAISVATAMAGASAPAFWMLSQSPVTAGTTQTLAPYIAPAVNVITPYSVPLIAVGVGTALAYDIWHMPHGQVRTTLKKLGKWADHEIEMIISHLKHHKKKNPKMFHGVSKHHAKKLEKLV